VIAAVLSGAAVSMGARVVLTHTPAPPKQSASAWDDQTREAMPDKKVVDQTRASNMTIADNGCNPWDPRC